MVREGVGPPRPGEPEEGGSVLQQGRSGGRVASEGTEPRLRHRQGKTWPVWAGGRGGKRHLVTFLFQKSAQLILLFQGQTPTGALLAPVRISPLSIGRRLPRCPEGRPRKVPPAQSLRLCSRRRVGTAPRAPRGLQNIFLGSSSSSHRLCQGPGPPKQGGAGATCLEQVAFALPSPKPQVALAGAQRAPACRD